MSKNSLILDFNCAKIWNLIFSITYYLSLLYLWGVLGWILHGTIITGELETKEGDIWIMISFTALWLWALIYGIIKILSKISREVKIWTMNFLLKNIIAPIIVSFVIYLITGQVNITLALLPIFGGLSIALKFG